MTTPNETPPVDLSPAPSAPPPQRPFYQQPDFWLGFVGWYVVNGLWWGLAQGNISMWFLGFPLNVVVLLVAAFKRLNVAGGILTALALNFLIALPFGAINNAMCGIPFFSANYGSIFFYFLR